MSDNTENLLDLSNPGLFRSQAYVDDPGVDADDCSSFEVSNPADGRVLTRVPNKGVVVGLEYGMVCVSD